jgi:8-oxo-dGTP diphosphatase
MGDSTWHFIGHKKAPRWVNSYERRYRRSRGTADVWGKCIILTGRNKQYKLSFGFPPKGWDAHGQCAVPTVGCSIFVRDCVKQRRTGRAIVDYGEKGILVVSGKHKKFMLPGGGVERHESRTSSAVRELKEETGLEATKIEYLFRHRGSKHKSYGKGYFRNREKIFLIEAEGKPKPDGKEVKYIDFYKPGKNIELTGETKAIIERYYKHINSWSYRLKKWFYNKIGIKVMPILLL